MDVVHQVGAGERQDEASTVLTALAFSQKGAVTKAILTPAARTVLLIHTIVSKVQEQLFKASGHQYQGRARHVISRRPFPEFCPFFSFIINLMPIIVIQEAL